MPIETIIFGAGPLTPETTADGTSKTLSLGFGRGRLFGILPAREITATLISARLGDGELGMEYRVYGPAIVESPNGKHVGKSGLIPEDQTLYVKNTNPRDRQSLHARYQSSVSKIIK